jgi:hypothetical protein
MKKPTYSDESAKPGTADMLCCIPFGRGASKSTTQGGIFDLNMYVTFDCAGIAAF